VVVSTRCTLTTAWVTHDSIFSLRNAAVIEAYVEKVATYSTKSVLLLCLTTLRGPIELVTIIQWRRGEGVSSLMLIIAYCRLTWLWPRMVNPSPQLFFSNSNTAESYCDAYRARRCCHILKFWERAALRWRQSCHQPIMEHVRVRLEAVDQFLFLLDNLSWLSIGNKHAFINRMIFTDCY